MAAKSERDRVGDATAHKDGDAIGMGADAKGGSETESAVGGVDAARNSAIWLISVTVTMCLLNL